MAAMAIQLHKIIVPEEVEGITEVVLGRVPLQGEEDLHTVSQQHALISMELIQ